ncbi:hypothetical protein ZWY2020_057328 [Hordeum vulgare]|nr:hypothetical protein ZWY2020_057328 [Hordeum vulgare]
MEKAAASWLVNKVLKMMCDGLVGAFVASKELGLNSEKIKHDLEFASALLQAAQTRGVGDNDGMGKLVQALSTKAHEAEDVLDELHYFIIQDQLDNTQHAVPDLGKGLRGHARHSHQALRHIVGFLGVLTIADFIRQLICTPCMRV